MSEIARVVVAVPDRWRRLFFPPRTWARLSALAAVEVIEGDHQDPAALAPLLTDAQVLVSGWGNPPLDATVLAAAPRLRLVAHTGASVKPIVTGQVWERGIRVTQAGAAMARAVAEASLALTLALLHRVHRFDAALRSGVSWEQAKQAPPRRELAGCPVGVIGASRTCRCYIDLVRALGGRISVYDPHLDAREAARLGVRVVDLTELLTSSRVVALHAPAVPETHHLLGRRELALIPDGGLLVNTARSWLVDEPALVEELRSGRIDAAIDVFDDEPLPVDSPLRRLPNVLLTPHEAAGTLEARHRQGATVVGEIDRFLDGRPLWHEVTREMLDRIG